MALETFCRLKEKDENQHFGKYCKIVIQSEHCHIWRKIVNWGAAQSFNCTNCDKIKYATTVLAGMRAFEQLEFWTETEILPLQAGFM